MPKGNSPINSSGLLLMASTFVLKRLPIATAGTRKEVSLAAWKVAVRALERGSVG